jgi:hypothetical protein
MTYGPEGISASEIKMTFTRRKGDDGKKIRVSDFVVKGCFDGKYTPPPTTTPRLGKHGR